MKKKYVKKCIIVAVSIIMLGIFVFSVSAESKISCVDNFDASKQTNNSIKLTWNSGISTDGYVIERKETNSKSDYKKIIDINNYKTTNYTDNKIESGKRYTYRIMSYSVNKGNKIYSRGEYLNTASNPVAVKNFELISQNEKSISLKWNKINGVSGYTVYRADDKSKNKYRKICDVKGIEKYTDTKLIPSSRYNYYVCAYIDIDGKRSYSGKSDVIKTATNPSQIKNLVAKKRTKDAITLKWDKSENASGYVIYRMTNNENDYEGEWVPNEYGDYYYKTRVGEYIKYSVVGDGSKTTYTNKNLNECQGYYYRVQPYYKSDGKYYYGDYRGITTGTVTDEPEVEVFSRNKRVMAKWYPVSGADGYEIYLSDNKDGKYVSQGTTDDNIFLTKQLVDGKTYYIRVCAYYKLDDGKKIYSNYKTYSVKCTKANKVNKYTVGTTYIEIDLDMQHLWYFEDGKLVVSTDVVTGLKNARDTSTGLFEIYNKESPARLVGETWDTYVTYWLAVTYDGQGIHDSTWRYDYEYGGNTYTYDGSHGCINTPYGKVEKLYEKVEIGTPVVIYEKSSE